MVALNLSGDEYVDSGFQRRITLANKSHWKVSFRVSALQGSDLKVSQDGGGAILWLLLK